MASSVAVLDILLTANSTPATAALGRTQAQLSATGKQATATSATVKKAFLGIGLAAAGVATALYKIGEEFDKSYDTIRTRTGATGKELTKLEGSFKKVVSSVPTDFDTAANAVAGLNQRLDLSGKPLTRLTKQLTQLSKITGDDIQENVEATTRLFGDWSIRTKEMTPTLDKLYRLTQTTGVGFSDLSRLMVQFGSPLRQLGFSFDEAAVMFARFEKEGVNISTAVPGLRMALKNLSVPSDELAATFEKLGINTKDIHAGLLDVFDAIKSGKIDAETASQIFGGRAWADMKAAVEEGRFEFNKLIDDMNSGKDTISKAERSTRDFSEQWTLFKNNIKVAVEPIATKFFKGIGKLMGEVTKAFKKEGLKGVVDLLLQKLNDATPKMLEAGGKLAAGIVKGFWDAGIWSKLFIGGLLFSKLGGSKAIGALGTKIGSLFGKTFGKAFVVGAVIGFAMLIPEAYKLGQKIGHAIRDGLGGDLADIIEGTVTKTLSRQDLRDAFMSGNNSMQAALDSLKQMGYSTKQAAGIVNRWYSRMGTDQERAGKGFDKVAEHAKTGGKAVSAATGKTGKDVKAFAGGAATDLGRAGQATDKFASGAGHNFDRTGASAKHLKDVIGQSVDSLAGAVMGGLGKIGQATNKALKAFGVKQLSFDLGAAVAEGAGKGKQRGGIIRAAMGTMVPGRGSGDRVPAMLEPGEVVINRKAVAALGGAARTNSINDLIPRFAGGGIVALGRRLQGQGYEVGENPAFGGVSPVHVPGSYHYSGLAIDVNDDLPPYASGGGEPGSLDRLYSQLNGMPGVIELLWRVAGHFDHLHVAMSEGASAVGIGRAAAVEKIKRVILQGPDGALKDLGQAALDKTTKAANDYIMSKAPVETGGVGASVPTGPVQDMARAMIDKIWGPSQWSPFNLLEMSEAGWNPRAVNPSSGAAGLAQALPPSKYPPGAWPYAGPESAKLQLQWMMGYIKERYGTPAGAWAFHQANNWYQRGGVVQKLAGGGRPRRRGGGGGGSTRYPGQTNPGGGLLGSPLAGPERYPGQEAPPGLGWLDSPWTKFGKGKLPNNVRNHMKAFQGAIDLLDTAIPTAETMAQFSSSELGAELGPGEKAEQIGLYQQLLTNLEGLAQWSKKGIATRYLKPAIKSRLQETLTALTGGGGSIGRILETKLTIDQLGATSTGSSLDPWTIEAMRAFANVARYGAFNTSPYMGAAAKGGVALVGQRGPELAHLPSGTRVHSAADTQAMVQPNVEVKFTDGALEFLGDFVEVRVNGRLQQRAQQSRLNRKAGIRE